jgi:hypothetical protein
MKPEPTEKTTYSTLEPIKIIAPTVKVSKNALIWLSCLADLHEHEVGVFGFVDELPDNTYLIRDIFYPKHCEANGATCEISPEGETLMAEWLIAHNREADIGKAKFWGHSHVNMGVFPSVQDEDQAIERMKRTESYFIRGIFNKDGLLSISFYDYKNKRRFDHIKWETEADTDEMEIRKKISALKLINIPVSKYVRPYSNFAGDDNVMTDYYRQTNYGGTPGSNSTSYKKNGQDQFFVKRNKKNKHNKSYSYEFAKP